MHHNHARANLAAVSSSIPEKPNAESPWMQNTGEGSSPFPFNSACTRAAAMAKPQPTPIVPNVPASSLKTRNRTTQIQCHISFYQSTVSITPPTKAGYGCHTHKYLCLGRWVMSMVLPISMVLEPSLMIVELRGRNLVIYSHHAKQRERKQESWRRAYLSYIAGSHLLISRIECHGNPFICSKLLKMDGTVPGRERERETDRDREQKSAP